MYRIGFFVAFFSIFLPLTAVAQPAPDKYSQESVVLERSETTYRMHADGTGERVLHVVVRIQSQGAAQEFGVLVFSYASANETPHIKLVRVHKQDGTTVDTPAEDAIEMPAAVTREAPLYSDLKEKHLPVRSLSVGDTLEYEVDTTIDKPEAPGQFWGTEHFVAPGTAVVLSQVINLEVPKDKYVQVWSPNHKPVIAEHDGMRSYSWDVAQLTPAPKPAPGTEAAKVKPPKDPDEDADGRKLPSVAWTTFHSWAEVGDWYRSLAFARAQPSDMLRARADEITKDAKTPVDQVRAIYEFVSMKTRYVGIDFGVGRYQPHAAAEVLANQYGDCKDKDTLLEALLRAKGFETAPALIGAGIAPVAEVPTPAVFNHVITTVNLPAGRIWLDSTPGPAPFRYLLAVIRDQKALVVPAEGAAMLESTPADAPYPFSERFEAVGSLGADGVLTAKMTSSFQDDQEPVVRTLARSVAPNDWDKMSQYISSATGFGGTTSNTQFKDVENASLPIALTYDYTRKQYGDWDNKRIVPLFPVLEFTALTDDTGEPNEDIQLGAPRKLVAISRIKLPGGYRTDLPDAVHVVTDFATFDKTYRFDGSEIVAERNVTILKPKLPKAEWKRYQTFTKNIGIDGETWIQLIQPLGSAEAAIALPGKPVAEPKLKTRDKQTVIVQATPPPAVAASAPAEIADDASPRELMQGAMTQMRSGDLVGAKATLDKVKAKDPAEELLWAGYGTLAAMHRNYDEAETDFKNEIANHPDNEGVVGALASVEDKNGEAAAAQNTLQKYLDRHPEDLRLSLVLYSVQSKAEEYSAALKTLQNAADHNPDDREVQSFISETLLHLNRKDEAAAAAKGVLDGTDNPNLQNNAAYILAETGIDLPYAESMSRKSIEQQEDQSANITTAEVNSKAFVQASMLLNSWDTLGWIYYREGKLEDARPLIAAAWLGTLRAEIGDHLAQVYEDLKRPNDALTTYELAQTAIKDGVPGDIRQHIRSSIARLEATGAKTTRPTAVQGLQDLRTFKVPGATGVKGWGSYRLEITTSGLIEAQRMSGEKQIEGIEPSLKKMTFPELIPPGSKAHLLRSAVVSCSMGTTCEVVLVPDGGLQTEQQ